MQAFKHSMPLAIPANTSWRAEVLTLSCTLPLFLSLVLIVALSQRLFGCLAKHTSKFNKILVKSECEIWSILLGCSLILINHCIFCEHYWLYEWVLRKAVCLSAERFVIHSKAEKDLTCRYDWILRKLKGLEISWNYTDIPGGRELAVVETGA